MKNIYIYANSRKDKKMEALRTMYKNGGGVSSTIFRKESIDPTIWALN
jgi:hypothetical protein